MSSYIVSGAFWAQTAERAVKTFAQSAIALLTGQGIGLLDINWQHVLSVAGLAAVVSVLTSVGSGPFSQNGTPNLVRGNSVAAPAAAKLVPQPAPQQPAAAKPAKPAAPPAPPAAAKPAEPPAAAKTAAVKKAPAKKAAPRPTDAPPEATDAPAPQ
jgi:hypothetical protein